MGGASSPASAQRVDSAQVTPERMRNLSLSRFATIWTLVVGCVIALLWVDFLPHLRTLLSGSLQYEETVLATRIVSDISRSLGVTLSMLVALCALAIPLTANVYTPKLIEIFLADSWNRAQLSFLILANVTVLWNEYLLGTVGAEDARWRVLFCVGIAIVAMLSIGPYLLYVLSFLVPRTIVMRLQREIQRDLNRVGRESEPERQALALEAAVTNVQYLGRIALRATERYDRDTALECLQSFRHVFDTYQARKEYLPKAFFSAKCKELLGLGGELAIEVERGSSTLEVALLQELDLLLPLAMRQLPDLVTRVGSLTRHFGLRTAERKDTGPREMVILHFNTFLRQSLKERNADAFYKLVYQYRRFAEDLLEVDTRLARRIAFFLDYYGHQAVRMGMVFLINVAAYDLAALTDQAFRVRAPGRKQLLEVFLNLDRGEEHLVVMPGLVKSQIMLAAKLATRGEKKPYEQIVEGLRKVPVEVLKETFGQIIAAREENFWEIADRRRHLDHIEPEFRPAVRDLREVLVGSLQPGLNTLLFLRDKPNPKAKPAMVPHTRQTERPFRAPQPELKPEPEAPQPAPEEKPAPVEPVEPAEPTEPTEVAHSVEAEP